MLRMLKSRFAAALVVALAALFVSPPSRGSQASCVMPTSGTVSGLTLVNDINACNNSLISVWSGATAPAGPQAGQFWYNTNTNYIQEYDGASWLNLWYVDASNHLIVPQIGGGTTAVMTAASTTDLGSVPQTFIAINGTTTISNFGTSAAAGTIKVVAFNSATPLTYGVGGGGSISAPNSANYTTQNSDIGIFLRTASGVWLTVGYQVGSVVTKASPTTSDFVMIQDAAAGNAPKKSLISSLLSLVGVTSIDSKVGAFTTANGIESTGSNVIQLPAARRTLPTTQVLTSGTNATYTTPANALWIEVTMVGGGSGGGGGNNGSLSTAGGATCWIPTGAGCSGPFSIASGGSGSNTTTVGAGGTAGGGGYSLTNGNSGTPGGSPSTASNGPGGSGGGSCLGGGAPGNGAGAGAAAGANTGAGGGGGSSSNGSISGQGGSGGASGGCVRLIITSPASTYAFTIGAGGAGASGANVSSSTGSAGGAGGSGRIMVVEHYGSWLMMAMAGFSLRRRRPANDNGKRERDAA